MSKELSSGQFSVRSILNLLQRVAAISSQIFESARQFSVRSIVNLLQQV